MSSFMHIVRSITSLLFPSSPSYDLVVKATVFDIRVCYQPQQQKGVVWLSRYEHSLIRACITAGKFEGNQRALDLLSALLLEYLTTLEGTILIIPVPLHKKRERARGYNQVTEVANRSVKHSKMASVTTSVIKRSRATLPQSHANRKVRLRNVAGAFTYHGKDIPWHTYRHILILDDVYTTGATLFEVKQTLLLHTPKETHGRVKCVALAH